MSTPFPVEPQADVAALERVKDLQNALGVVTQSITKNLESEGKLTRSSAEENGRNYRASVKAISDYVVAKNTGSAAAIVNSLADNVGNLQRSMSRDDDVLKAVAAAAHLESLGAVVGGDPTRNDANYNNKAWETYAQQEKNPGTKGVTTLNDYDNMVAAYGPRPKKLSAGFDSRDEHALDVIEKAVGEERAFVNANQAWAEAAVGAQAVVDAHAAAGTRVSEDEASRFLQNISKNIGSDADIARNLKYAKDHADKADQLVGANKEAWDKLEEERKAEVDIRTRLLAAANPETERDQVARILAKPKFQAWAAANGFHVGHIEPADPNKTYNTGEVTTSGVYVEGPDDRKALLFADHQREATPGTWHPFLHNAVKTSPVYGRIEVQRPGLEKTALQHPDGMYYSITDSAGEQHFLTPAQRQQLLDAQAATPGAPPVALQASAEGPRVDNTPEIVAGRFEAPKLSDPAGSVRVSGNLYVRNAQGKLELAEDRNGHVSKPGMGEHTDVTVTGGGKERPLHELFRELKSRRDANVANRMGDQTAREEVPFSLTNWLEQSLTPTYRTDAEKAAEVERQRVAGVQTREADRVATESADASGRPVEQIKKLTAVSQGELTNPYVETNREQLQNEAKDADKRQKDRWDAQQQAEDQAPEGSEPPSGAGAPLPVPRPQNVPDQTPGNFEAAKQRALLLAQKKVIPQQDNSNVLATPEKIPFVRENTAPNDSTVKLSMPAKAESGPLASPQRAALVVPTASDAKEGVVARNAAQDAAQREAYMKAAKEKGYEDRKGPGYVQWTAAELAGPRAPRP